MASLTPTIRAWSEYLKSHKDWRTLIVGIDPRSSGCGLIYEIANPIERPNESFAIADMRQLEISEPHLHRHGETEIYIVLEGSGGTVVGHDVYRLHPGDVIVIAPGTIHITIPASGLILAVINTPPFAASNYVPLAPDSADVVKALARLRSEI